MNGWDVFVVTALLFSVIAGLWRGFITELFSLASWLLAVAAALVVGGEVGRLAASSFTEDPLLQWLAGAAVLALLVFAVLTLLRYLLVHVLHAVGLRGLDRFLGFWFGLARGGVVVVLAAQVALWLGAEQTSWWQSAKTRVWAEQAIVWVQTMWRERSGSKETMGVCRSCAVSLA